MQFRVVVFPSMKHKLSHDWASAFVNFFLFPTRGKLLIKQWMNHTNSLCLERRSFFCVNSWVLEKSCIQCIQTKEGGFPPFKIRNGKNGPLPCRMCGCGRESKWDLKEIVNWTNTVLCILRWRKKAEAVVEREYLHAKRGMWTNLKQTMNDLVTGAERAVDALFQ